MEREDTELEDEITLAGNALLSTPSSVSQLLLLLEKLENCLMRMDRSPSNSMQRAVDLAMKALMAKELLSHLDADVKVSVALCFSQTLRLTAPTFSHDDEKMEEILQLIVASFENISDTSSPSYQKRVLILENFANVRSCFLMVDRKCYSLIMEMFKHFLTNIREHHPDIVFSSMGLIMIIILDEIKEIPLEIVNLFLDCIRNRNQDVLPIAQKLGERIFENCGSKLAPYVPRANYCGQKRSRDKLQDSRSHTEVVVKKENDRKEGCGYQDFEEEYREEDKRTKEKDFKEKILIEEDEDFPREVMKHKRSRKLVKPDIHSLSYLTKEMENRRKVRYKGKQAMDTKCSMRNMHEFLSNLKGNKRSIIENSIFSAYLDIPSCPINRNLTAALIECYDANMDAIIVAGCPLKFCGKEIEKCIGLRFEGERVDLKFFRAQIIPQMVQRYFEIVNGKERTKKKSTGASKEKMDVEMLSPIRKSRLLQKLNLMRVDGKGEAEGFLRLSIVYMFNVYFFPTSSPYISWWPLKYLQNLNDFGSYAWGQAVYAYLLSSLKKAASKLAGQSKFYALLNGCVPLLQTLVAERISKLQVLDPSTNPNPSVLYCNKDRMSFDAYRKVLADLQPDEIKECKECEAVVKCCKSKVKSTKEKKISHRRNKLENCLMRMDRSPSNSMQRAVDLAMKALMAKELLSHLDADVKVSVALCFSQTLRLTAPTFSHDDEKMELIVASFENISDTSSPSYQKRVLILENFANVRSCLLMVDRKCYSLIMEMFKHFLTNIREHHPDIVFSSMGLIMIIILDEIKEIPLEIVNLFLDCIRNRNQDVLPIAQKLGERIFENCGSKLAPYVPRANYCGQKRSRDKLQDSRSHTEVVVKKENDRKEGCGYQDFEEEYREEDKRTKEKDFKEKILIEEDEDFPREVMKHKRSRKLVKPDIHSLSYLTKEMENRRKVRYKGKQAMDTKCSMRNMHEFLSNLKGNKRSIIENSIFSAYLDIPSCPINRNLAAALIECYDANMDAIIVAGCPLKFCGKEIEKCIGLRFEGERVDLKFFRAQIIPQMVQRYFEIVNGKERTKKKSTGASKEKMDVEMRSPIRKSRLLQKLNLMRVDGKGEAEGFLRLSIVYMFNVYFFPTSSPYISWWPLKYLQNLNDFGSYAWGQAVYAYLLSSLKKAASKLAGQSKFYAFLNGCVPLLQTLVAERISKLQVLDPSTNPNPSVLYCNKDRMSFDAYRKVLADLQPDEIKECKECEAVVKSCKAKVKSTKEKKI